MERRSYHVWGHFSGPHSCRHTHADHNCVHVPDEQFAVRHHHHLGVPRRRKSLPEVRCLSAKAAAAHSRRVLPFRYLSFYVLSVDSISLLTIVASCLRLPIYVTCQPLLRKEMYQFICEFNERSSPSKFLRSRGSRQSPIGLFPIVSFYQMCPTTHALKGFHLRFVHLVDMILISK